MKQLSIEEKAHNYDEAIKRANSLLSGNQLGNAWIYKLLPELEESEGERIKEVILKALMADEAINILVESGIYYEDVESWLEKQCEHANFRNAIQIGDKVTRNQDGVLVNLSQLKRVAKPAEEYNIRGIGSKHAEGKLKELIEKQCKQKLDEISNVCEFSIETWIKIVDYVLTEHNGIGNYLIDPEVKDTAEKLQKKYKFDAASEEWDRVYRKGLDAGVNKGKAIALKEQKPADKIQLGKKYKCIASPRYTAFMKGSIYEPKDKFLCSLMNFCSDCFEPIEYVEQKPADKVEPKFKVGDIVIDPYGDVYHIIEINNNSYKTDDGRFILFENEDAYRLWTIQDAKDGDVLVASDGSIFLFKGAIDCACKHYVALTADGAVKFNEGLEHYWETSTAVHPATKEQHDLLFQKMKEAGYEWDAKKKELKKIEQKHSCELNNSYTYVKFPFKAKVKSSGKIVTIHDGQLSYDGKEWIKYQSDSEDGYKVYEPNNLLELVCETEQNPTWNVEDEKTIHLACEFIRHHSSLIDSIDGIDCTTLIDRLKSLKDRVQPKQGWSDEDEKYSSYICAALQCYYRLREDRNNTNGQEELDKARNWLYNRLKSLKPQSQWKPSDEQMKALTEALSLANNCGEETAFDLRTLHEQLKKLREE